MVAALNGTSVLVADDDADNLEILSFLIGLEGGTVRGARTAREALELLLTWTPDVLLLDISMPEMDGYELLAAIRGVQRFREIPAVAVTAHAYEHDKQRAKDAGFAEHITKPYDAATLIGLVEKLAPKKVTDGLPLQ